MISVRRRLRPLLFVLAALTAAPSLVLGAVADKDDWCDESRSWNWNDRNSHFCEVREFTIDAPRGALHVNAGMNGGIQVEAWDGRNVLVQAKVEVWANTSERAEELASKITVKTSDGRLIVDGPDPSWGKGRTRVGWGVSYRVYVPASTDLTLETHNGGISIDGVRGTIQLEAMNGALALHDVGGDVYGRTVNGSLSVDLNGDHWSGEGLDLVTTNGGVVLNIPEDYSAKLETGTTNGRMNVDFPVVVKGEMNKRLRVELGRNGAPIRAITTNGSVKVRRTG